MAILPEFSFKFVFTDAQFALVISEIVNRAEHEIKSTKLNTGARFARGSQYCSQDYIEVAVNNRIKISMTENGDRYENALAERMNRTIKEEFGLDIIVKTKAQVSQVVEESVELCNHYRPHLALKMKTPNHFHYQTKIPIT
jgi:transposase InsO family protein